MLLMSISIPNVKHVYYTTVEIFDVENIVTLK